MLNFIFGAIVAISATGYFGRNILKFYFFKREELRLFQLYVLQDESLCYVEKDREVMAMTEQQFQIFLFSRYSDLPYPVQQRRVADIQKYLPQRLFQKANVSSVEGPEFSEWEVNTEDKKKAFTRFRKQDGSYGEWERSAQIQ